MSTLRKVKQHLVNLPGWRTNRKIVVFESDDWGSIRMPSTDIYNRLMKEGIRVDRCPYNKYDNLESSEDLYALYDRLKKYKDRNGRHPIFTANFNVANPNFDEIRKNGFTEYSYVDISNTYHNYRRSEPILKIWEQGFNEQLVLPQYHGREHISPIIWLELLGSNHKVLRKAFDAGVYGLSFVTHDSIQVPYLASLIFRNDLELQFVKDSITDGARIFKSTFGYTSKSFIAPVYTWDKSLEETLSLSGVRYIQGGNIHKTYNFQKSKFRRRFHSLGARNNLGQSYLNRNASFEPSISGGEASLKELLGTMKIAFRMKKPLVVSSHRLNYIGTLSEENRRDNLNLLGTFFDILLSEYPDVEFMSSEDLGDLISFNDF